MLIIKYLFTTLLLVSIGIQIYSLTHQGVNPPKIISSARVSPLGEESVAADMAKLMEFFKKSQNSCNGKKGVYQYKHHPHGYFSVVHVIANSLLEATASNHLLVHPGGDRSEYISRQRCESQNLFECIYQPLGIKSCPGPVVIRNTAFVFDRSTEIFVGDKVINRLKLMAGLEGDHGTLFYVSAAVNYVTRLRQEGINHLNTIVESTLGKTSLKNVIGVQMRLGENGLGRMRGSPEMFARAVAQIQTSYGLFEKVWVSTNGTPEDVKEFKRLVAKWGGPPVVQSNIKFWQLTLNGMLTPSERTDALNNQEFDRWDEAMTIHAEMTAIAHCGYVVSSMDSNVGRYLFEEMYVHNGFTPSLPFFDVTQTMWFSGWRSTPFPHGHLLRGMTLN